MNPISIQLVRSYVRSYAQQARIEMQLSGGTAVLSIEGAFLMVSAPLTEMDSSRFIWRGTELGAYVVVGRENCPPLKRLARRAEAELKPLTRHRCAFISRRAEARDLIRVIALHGSSVDDDIYMFPPTGDWLLYVSHHNEICAYVRDRPYTMPHHAPRTTARRTTSKAKENRVTKRTR
jgi:hypothetical protein